MRLSNSPPNSRGFSLVELLIVVAIIATLVAIAVPNLFESKQAAYNASAISSLRLLYSAEASYRASNPQYGDLTCLAFAARLEREFQAFVPPPGYAGAERAPTTDSRDSRRVRRRSAAAEAVRARIEQGLREQK